MQLPGRGSAGAGNNRKGDVDHVAGNQAGDVVIPITTVLLHAQVLLWATVEGVVNIHNIAFGDYGAECGGVDFLQTNFIAIGIG